MISLKEIWNQIIEKNSYPKNKWIELNGSELSEYQDELYDIINKTYSSIGGNPKIKSPKDINTSDLNFWITTDVDDDPEMDALMAGKTTKFGKKFTIGGSDGGSDAKKILIQTLADKLKVKGNYAELSHTIADILGSKNVNVIKDEDLIRTVLGKEIEYLQDGYYNREIGGIKYKKRLFGIPQ